MKVATGLDLLNREYGDDEASDVTMPGKRAVTFELSMLVREDEAYLQSRWRRRQQDDILLTLGDTQPNRPRPDHAWKGTSPLNGQFERGHACRRRSHPVTDLDRGLVVYLAQELECEMGIGRFDPLD